MTVRVLIADDHPVFLDGLRTLLDSTDGITVAGAARDGEALVELASRVAYEVAVVDLDMPVMDGVEAARRLLAQRPEVAVLMLTMHQDDDSLRRALAAGARGYLLKGAAHGAIARAVFALADGETVLAGGVAPRVLQAASAHRPASAFPRLSARETEVLDLVARGLGNHAVAGRLFVSTKTVQNHVSSILAKTGCATRSELVARARDAGLGGRP
ncbi:MAG TPA: response regulator transcription factor [Actinomycetales bacterium]|nr:response regulator transcription factor [Actinomycetales bacterium]